MDEIRIQYKFSLEDDGKVYADSLYFTQKEFESLSQEEIDVLKQKRFDEWKKVNQAIDKEVKPEDEIKYLDEEKKSLEERLAAVVNKKIILEQSNKKQKGVK